MKFPFFNSHKSIEGKEYDIQGFRMFLTEKERLQKNIIDNGIHEWAETALVPQFIRRRQTVLDIGANIGYYSLLFSRLVGPSGKVWAFEPLEVNFARLCRNIELNASNVTTVNKALGIVREQKRYRFHAEAKANILPNFGGWTMLGNESDDGNVSIETIPLDDFVEENRLPRISFMKIDVEGYELHVLRGAKQVLTKHKPILMVEFVCPENRGNISDLLELADYLRSLGYTICRMEKKPWPHIREVQDSDFEAPVHFNAICYFGHHPVHV